LNAIYYEPFPNGSVVTYFNVTYVPRRDEAIYLATLAYVIRGDPKEHGINVPETVCFRRHEHPATLTYCFLMPGLLTDLLFGTITTALDFGLKILSGERLELNLIDENGKRYAPVEWVVVEMMNITRDGSWYLASKEYVLRGLGEHVIGRGSYAFQEMRSPNTFTSTSPRQASYPSSIRRRSARSPSSKSGKNTVGKRIWLSRQ
jgi:hypothetical protein